MRSCKRGAARELGLNRGNYKGGEPAGKRQKHDDGKGKDGDKGKGEWEDDSIYVYPGGCGSK